MDRRRVGILGSTGSIGHQTLEVVSEHPDLFSVGLLTAQTQWQMLVQQALLFKPSAVVIGEPMYYSLVKEALADTPVQVYAGTEALEQLVQDPQLDVVLVAIVGYAGLLPTLRAIECGKRIALANKESLVAGGSILMPYAQKYNASIVPVDSEHSAIFQCLQGELTPPERLLLTASGGPFRGFRPDQLERITPLEALAHPAWNMGAKISVDSATLMNKGLEVIEAHWLFGMPYERIDVLVHPEAVVHSMVQFSDGAIKAQMGTPTMRTPIQYALSYPFRLESETPRYLFGPGENLTFNAPDTETFRCLPLAIQAGKVGGNLPCALNAANEVAVKAFLDTKIGFLTITTVVERTLETIEVKDNPSLDDIFQTDAEARRTALWLVEKLKN